MGRVFDLQRFCLHDGPGLRTTVFLKGCPLRCRWCANPESQRPEPDLLYNRARCMRCGACVAACPQALIEPDAGGVAIRREDCDACGKCAEVCPTVSLVVKGREMTAAEVVGQVARDRGFYASSGGGATISGGEPFLQSDFLFELLAGLREAGIPAAVETTGCSDWNAIARCLPLLDCLLVDVKHVDSAKHREWTGIGCEVILANVKKMRAAHPRVQIRLPVIPGFNADSDSAAQFAEFFVSLRADVELLPYHVLGEAKYAMLGRTYPGADIAAANASAATKRLQEFLLLRGVDASIVE